MASGNTNLTNAPSPVHQIITVIESLNEPLANWCIDTAVYFTSMK